MKFSKVTLSVAALALLLFLCSCKGQPSVRLNESASKEVQELLTEIDEYNAKSRYADAIPVAQKLLKAVEKRKGPNHPGTASCLNVLGGLYTSSGDYAKAEPVLQRAVTILEKAGQSESRMLAASLGLLAKTQLNLGQLPQAETSAKKALNLRIAEQGKTGLGTSTALNTLAEVHVAMRQYDLAEAELLAAIDIRMSRNSVHGLIISLNSLSRLYCLTGSFQAAEPIAKDVLALGKDVLGPDHLHVGESLNILGWIYAATGREADALKSLKEAQRIDMIAIDQIKGVPSERQKMALVAKMQQNYHRYLSVVVQAANKVPGAAQMGLDAVLQRKGIILDVQKQFQQALTRGDDDAMETLAELNEVRAALSQLAFADSDDVDMGSYNTMASELHARREVLEAKLEKMSRAFLRSQQQSRATADAIAKALPRGSALVELVNVEMTDFNKLEADPVPRYVAFVLTPDSMPRVRMVNLADAALLDKLVSGLHKRLPSSSPSTNGPVKLLAGLRQVLIAPIEKDFEGIDRLFISPDGTLNLLPLEILPDRKGRFLVEDYMLTYLNSGRDLLGSGESTQPEIEALLMGDPDFDDSKAVASAKDALKRSSDMGSMQFAPLPGTRQEVETITNLLGRDKVTTVLGDQATEQVLMSTRTPRYLHLATHGFFLSDQILEAIAGEDVERRSEIMQRMENPLVRSGLVFAGANISLREGNTSTGIVTAEKILGMKLSGTELVVLSACETGVGKVNNGEGVFGLQRSFAQAGANSLLMSMWPVSDMETMELMTHFYKTMAEKGVSPNEALREAVLAEIKIVRERYGAANPALWGAFVYQQCSPRM